MYYTQISELRRYIFCIPCVRKGNIHAGIDNETIFYCTVLCMAQRLGVDFALSFSFPKKTIMQTIHKFSVMTIIHLQSDKIVGIRVH